MKLFPVFAALPALLLLCACSTDPCYDASAHGRASRTFFSAQVVNPDPPEDPSPAMTLPGKVANGIYEKRYLPAMTEKKSEKEEKLETQFGK